jgi:hypothetical protein
MILSSETGLIINFTMSPTPYCELVDFPDQPAPEREIMPSAPEMNDVDIPIENMNSENLGNRAGENIPIVVLENQPYDRFNTSNVLWSLMLIIWIGSHIALLLLVLSDVTLSEGIKIWAAIICVVETVLISVTAVFRDIIVMLVCVYFLEFFINMILMAIYLTETIASDFLLLLSIIKLFIACHKLRVDGF